MLSFSHQGHRFHLRAAAVVVHDGHLLLHRAPGDDFWSLPGGRVEAGETAADAVARELREELGTTAQVGALRCVVENFFAYAGERHHELGLYFDVALPAGSPLLDTRTEHAGDEGGRPLTFRWFTATGLAGADVRPARVRGLLAPGVLAHWVQRG